MSEATSYEKERLKILEMIDNGLITVDEGLVLLRSLDQRQTHPPVIPETVDETMRNADLAENGVVETPDRSLPSPEPFANEISMEASDFAGSRPSPEEMPADAVGEPQAAAQTIHAPEPEEAPEKRFTGPEIDPGIKKWRSYWWIPLWVGVGITVVSASLMYVAWNNGGFGFWFACTWFPFALGVLVMALAYASRTARWLHVRVHQKPGETPQKISISLPIPLRLTAWFFRTFKGRIPHMGNTGIDELIMALEATNPDTPFYVEVNEGENGERVEVYIG